MGLPTRFMNSRGRLQGNALGTKAKATTTVKRRPGASPLLFGKYLMNLAAFVSLEDISDALPLTVEEGRQNRLDTNCFAFERTTISPRRVGLESG
jgi:hypothetical protein